MYATFMSNDKSTLALTLAEKDLERIITQTIQAQVAAAFSARGGDITASVIKCMLEQKVDARGEPARYARDEHQSMVEHLCQRQLGEMVKASIISWIKEHESEIREAVVAQLNKKKTKDAIAGALLGSLVEATTSQYRFNISVTAAPPSRDD